jgi:transcriptional regulator with XRE-family HTH domain
MAERRRRPTLRDIAEETGLSTAAVSYALRGLQVPPETQQRVREAADRLGYQADPIARALASGRTGEPPGLELRDDDVVGSLMRLDQAHWLPDDVLPRRRVERPRAQATLPGARRPASRRDEALPVDEGGAPGAIAQRCRSSPSATVCRGGHGSRGVFDNAGSSRCSHRLRARPGRITVSWSRPDPDRPAERHREPRELDIVAKLRLALRPGQAHATAREARPATTGQRVLAWPTASPTGSMPPPPS